MKNIVLFGPPGCGKGTQSNLLVQKFLLKHIATGDMLRVHLNKETSLGMEAKSYIKQGALVPDKLVITMLENEVKQNLGVAGFLFDGFPRTIAQAVSLDALLDNIGFPINFAILLEVDHNELIKRIVQRGKGSGRADDTDPEVVKSRLITYEENTLPLKEYYTKQNKCFVLNGIGAIDEIFGKICKIIT